MTDQAYEIRNELALLEEALLTATPEMPKILRTIHAHLKKDPALVTLLSDEEASILVRGLKKVTATDIATTVAKSKPKKALNKTTLADL